MNDLQHIQDFLSLGASIIRLQRGGKKPDSETWNTTTDINVIQQWIAGGYNVGVVATNSKLVPIDLDAKGVVDGVTAFKSIVEELGIFDDCYNTLHETTPNNGHHLFFRSPNIIPFSQDGLAAGIEVRTGKHYTVVAPSRLTTGGYKIVTSMQIAQLPDPLERLITASKQEYKRETRNTTQSKAFSDTPGNQIEAYARAMYTNLISAIRSAALHTRNKTLNVCSYRMGRLLAWLGNLGVSILDYNAVRGELIDAGVSTGMSERETLKTVESGLKAGLEKPLDPDLSDSTGTHKQKSARQPVPDLPENSRVTGDYSACQWLGEYVNFSKLWSPRGYIDFHEAIGLWVLSTAIARRVTVHMGGNRFPSLYILLSGRTSLYSKTTTTTIGIDLLRAAGLHWLLAADDSSPQRFLYDMCGHVPENFLSLPIDKQEQIKRKVAFAGQKGWYYDEFGQHVSAMMRDGYMSDFRGHLRRFDDAIPEYTYSTIGRGENHIERPYLALLANITPSDLRPHTKRGSALWGDGFLARFAILTPPSTTRNRERFPIGKRIIPYNLIQPLHELHERLGIPFVEVITGEKGKGKNRETVVTDVHVTPSQETVLQLPNEVRDAYYSYNEGLLDCLTQLDNTDLDGNYSRFSEKALRVSMLLTAINGSDTIQLPQWNLAQTIVERWRAGLHEAYNQVTSDLSDETLADKCYAILEHHRKPHTAASLKRFIRNYSLEAIENCLAELAEEGLLEVEQTSKGTNRYSLRSDQKET